MNAKMQPIIYIHVEDPSMKVTLDELLRKFPGLSMENIEIIDHGSKSHLMKNLPKRLDGYAHVDRSVIRVLVLVDRDDSDCRELKNQLEEMAARYNLPTKSKPGADGHFLVVNRIVIEELEAWFFGDIDALRAAFPRIQDTLGKEAAYRHPDTIAGGTWEALHKVLSRAGYYKQGLPKIEVAQKIACHMEPSRNRSPSFQAFWLGLQALTNAPDNNHDRI